MHILMLTGQLPYPPYAGGALRTFGLLSGLHEAGHNVDLLTFTEPSQPDPLTPLSGLCERIVTVSLPTRRATDRLRDLVLKRRPDLVGRYSSPEFERRLMELLAQGDYDLAQIESLEMACYLPLIRQIRPALRTIYDSFNAEFDLQHRIFEIDRGVPARFVGAVYSLIQWRRLTRFERQVCESVDRVIAVSEADAVAFARLVPGLRAAIVPNGITVTDYLNPPTQILDLGQAALLFTGTMNYRPNVDAVIWFADNVLSRVRETVPDARLFIVGNRPHSRLDNLRARSEIEVTGYVQDMLPFLSAATVYVAPLRMGSGTRLKLLQAMAAGNAIVSTSLGAQGLNVSSGREMILADDAESFAHAVVGLLQNPSRRASIGQAARKLVCEQYDWSVIVPRLLKVYGEMGLK